MGLEALQKISVHENELPHACPDGNSLLGLWDALLCDGVVHLFENVMLK